MHTWINSHTWDLSHYDLNESRVIAIQVTMTWISKINWCSSAQAAYKVFIIESGYTIIKPNKKKRFKFKLVDFGEICEGVKEILGI